MPGALSMTQSARLVVKARTYKAKDLAFKVKDLTHITPKNITLSPCICDVITSTFYKYM